MPLQHTAGRWIAGRMNPGGGILIEKGKPYGGIIATVWGGRKRQVGDAALIAAAPELLAALRLCVTDLQAINDEMAWENGNSYGRAIDAALAAIAQATTEEQEAWA